MFRKIQFTDMTHLRTYLATLKSQFSRSSETRSECLFVVEGGKKESFFTRRKGWNDPSRIILVTQILEQLTC